MKPEHHLAEHKQIQNNEFEDNRQS